VFDLTTHRVRKMASDPNMVAVTLDPLTIVNALNDIRTDREKDLANHIRILYAQIERMEMESVDQLEKQIRVSTAIAMRDAQSKSLALKKEELEKYNEAVATGRQVLELRKQAVDLRISILGNIRVIARLRPLTSTHNDASVKFIEATTSAENAGRYPDMLTSTGVLDNSLTYSTERLDPKGYRFERVFTSESKTPQVFDEFFFVLESIASSNQKVTTDNPTKDDIDAAKIPVHGCIFAYGATSGGKTYNMLGPSDKNADSKTQEELVTQGFFYMCGVKLLDLVNTKADRFTSLTISAIEFNPQGYTIKDKVNTPHIDKSNLKKRTKPQAMDFFNTFPIGKSSHRTNMYIQYPMEYRLHTNGSNRSAPNDIEPTTQLKEVPITDLDVLRKALVKVKKLRANSSTTQNSDSSRTSLVLHFNLHGINGQTGESMVNVLSLIDMPGNEQNSQDVASSTTGPENQQRLAIVKSINNIGRAMKEYAMPNKASSSGSSPYSGVTGALIRHLAIPLEMKNQARIAFLLCINPFFNKKDSTLSLKTTIPAIDFAREFSRSKNVSAASLVRYQTKLDEVLDKAVSIAGVQMFINPDGTDPLSKERNNDATFWSKAEPPTIKLRGLNADEYTNKRLDLLGSPASEQQSAIQKEKEDAQQLKDLQDLIQTSSTAEAIHRIILIRRSRFLDDNGARLTNIASDQNAYAVLFTGNDTAAAATSVQDEQTTTERVTQVLNDLLNGKDPKVIPLPKDALDTNEGRRTQAAQLMGYSTFSDYQSAINIQKEVIITEVGRGRDFAQVITHLVTFFNVVSTPAVKSAMSLVDVETIQAKLKPLNDLIRESDQGFTFIPVASHAYVTTELTNFVNTELISRSYTKGKNADDPDTTTGYQTQFLELMNEVLQTISGKQEQELLDISDDPTTQKLLSAFEQSVTLRNKDAAATKEQLKAAAAELKLTQNNNYALRVDIEKKYSAAREAERKLKIQQLLNEATSGTMQDYIQQLKDSLARERTPKDVLADRANALSIVDNASIPDVGYSSSSSSSSSKSTATGVIKPANAKYPIITVSPPPPGSTNTTSVYPPLSETTVDAMIQRTAELTGSGLLRGVRDINSDTVIKSALLDVIHEIQKMTDQTKMWARFITALNAKTGARYVSYAVVSFILQNLTNILDANSLEDVSRALSVTDLHPEAYKRINTLYFSKLSTEQQMFVHAIPCFAKFESSYHKPPRRLAPIVQPTEDKIGELIAGVTSAVSPTGRLYASSTVSGATETIITKEATLQLSLLSAEIIQSSNPQRSWSILFAKSMVQSASSTESAPIIEAVVLETLLTLHNATLTPSEIKSLSVLLAQASLTSSEYSSIINNYWSRLSPNDQQAILIAVPCFAYWYLQNVLLYANEFQRFFLFM